MSHRDELPRAAWLEGEIQGQAQRFELDTDRAIRVRQKRSGHEYDCPGRSSDVAKSRDAADYSTSAPLSLLDLGSSNGTLVNGGRITAPRVLRNGDRITMGSHEFTFCQEAGGAPETAIEDAELAATNVQFARKLITVLVIDIRDYTGLAQRIDSEKLTQVAGALFRDAGKVLQERGAWAQKYIGDAMMAVWVHKAHGPAPGEIMSILGSVQNLLAIVDTLQGQFGLDTPVRIGCGINSGWASVGNVGSVAASDYTALGDVVNMAFRLESATRGIDCDLLVGNETMDFLTKFHDAGSRFPAVYRQVERLR